MTNIGADISSVFVSKEDGPLISRLNDSGIRSYIVPRKGFQGMKYITDIVRIIRDEKIDLVHLNTLTPFCKYAGIAAKLTGLPIVWFVRENPLISRSRRLRFWLKLLSSRIIFVDNDTRGKLLGYGNPRKVNVVYNGIDLKAFKPYKSDYLFDRLDMVTDKKLVGYIGLLTNRKGLIYLLNAFRQVKEKYEKCALVIIGGHKRGDEQYVSELKERSKGMDIHYIGPLLDVRDALNNLDIIVLPSLEERCSRTLLEALSCEKPVVATAVGAEERK
jgi:glycosyltransferase involved in cell wall biosynthesis